MTEIITRTDNILARIEKLEHRVSELERNESTNVQPKPGSAKPISIKEFILEKKPKNDTQKTLTIGYFLEQYDSVSTFNIDDVAMGFDKAKEAAPKNINLCLFYNVKKGHMMEGSQKKDNKKSWQLTNTGIKFLEGGFAKKANE